MLDLSHYPPRPRTPDKNGTPTIELLRSEQYPMQNVSLVHWPENRSVLDALRAGAEYVEFHKFEPGICRLLAAESKDDEETKLNCSCGIARATFPRYWEALGKHAQCLAMLTAHERRKAKIVDGFHYAWVTKLRPDPNLAVEYWMAPSWLRKAFTLPDARRTVFMTPWINSQCYSWSDWFQLMPRGLARRVLNVTNELSCTWLRCAQQVYGSAVTTRGGGCLYNERLLVEWVLSGQVERVGASVTAATDGKGSALAAVRAAPRGPDMQSEWWCSIKSSAASRSIDDDTKVNANSSLTLPLPQWLHAQASLVRSASGKNIRSKLLNSPDAQLGIISGTLKASGGGADERWRRWHRPLARQCR